MYIKLIALLMVLFFMSCGGKHFIKKCDTNEHIGNCILSLKDSCDYEVIKIKDNFITYKCDVTKE